MRRYAEILGEAWDAHLDPRAADAPTVISAFAGIGGSSLGYSMAGFRELLAIEWDSKAVETFHLNFPEVPVHQGDIADLTVDQVLDAIGLEPGELDVFDGSPPCQGFSTAGRRKFTDDRNQLFREYVRLMAGLQPRAFVMENVSGMVKGKMRLIFADILRELRAPGYRVRACLLNSKWFDVPQSRPRLIFIGVRHDLDVDPTFPAARAYPISLAASLADPYEHRFHGSISEATVQRWVETRRGANHDVRFNMYRARWNRPVNTITRTVGDVGQFHPDEPRLLSLGELMRCASYPDQFQFAHGFNPSVAGIGNSVPPLFMRAIASHVRSSVLEAVPVP